MGRTLRSNLPDDHEEIVQTTHEQEADRIARELITLHHNWSQKIRYLKSEGFRNSSISHILSELRGYPLSQQHVNNVLSRPLKGGNQGRNRGRPQEEDPLADKVVHLLLNKQKD